MFLSFLAPFELLLVSSLQRLVRGSRWNGPWTAARREEAVLMGGRTGAAGTGGKRGNVSAAADVSSLIAEVTADR